MKRLIIAINVLGACVALGFYANRPKTLPAPPAEPAPEAAPVQTDEPPHIAKRSVVTAAEVQQAQAEAAAPTQPLPAPFKTPEVKLIFTQAIESLLSPQSGYEQKQAIWKQLKSAGKLDDAITELEHRVANDPRSADSVTALGEGYYKKAGQTDDVREKAISAMKADQTLEAALNLDPSNWEARFTKTVGMSYWPPDLNKGQEVIEQFRTLIQQQESLPQQPQFARSYLKLGEAYQKAGQPDYAAQVWQRGVAWFPGNADLQGKLAAR